MKLQTLIKRGNIRMTVTSVADNPHMEMKAGMSHWRCTLRSDAGSMRVIFSQGSAYKDKAPELETVLDCLASDASMIENARSFPDWCSELGYDVDSRKAEKTWKACQRQYHSLAKLMGRDFQSLMFETDRL